MTFLRHAPPATAVTTRPAVPLRLVIPAMGFLFLALVPHIPFTRTNTFFWTEILISILYATATNLLIGYSGLVSFGQAAFFGAGVYSVGMLVTRAGVESMALNLVSAMVITGLIAAGVGALIVRATGLSFAILTLAFGQLFFSIVLRERTFGGEDGIAGIVRDGIGPLDLRPTNNFYYFTFVLLCAAMFVLWLVVSSPFGLMLRSIRDDADRAQFLGAPVRLYKLGVFAMVGTFSGLAGALHGYHTIFASAEAFGLERSIEPVVMSILGGVNNFFGPAVGAVVYELLRQWLRARTVSWVLWIGLGLLVIIVALRGGILGLFHQLARRASGRRSAAQGEVS